LLAKRGREAHLDAADGIDRALEPVEVDLDVVVDRDAETLGDRRDQVVGSVVEGGVELADLAGHAVGGQPGTCDAEPNWAASPGSKPVRVLEPINKMFIAAGPWEAAVAAHDGHLAVLS
jgi:hypothetical protein